MVVLVDNSNIVNISFARGLALLKDKAGKDPNFTLTDESYGFIFHMYVKKVMPIFKAYSDVVFLGEGKGSTAWRKSKYPLYKANRGVKADATEADKINHTYLIKLYNDCESFLNLFHTKVIRVENCEADDCMNSICRVLSSQGEEVRIISNDADLSQLQLFYKNVSQYNPITQKEIIADENILLKKAIVGDSSDNIAGVPGIGPATFDKMMADKAFYNKKMNPARQELVDLLLEIIDLRKFPKEYQDNIEKAWNETNWNTFDSTKVRNFFVDNGLRQCLNSWDFSDKAEISSRLALDNKEENNIKSAEEEILEILNS